MFSDKKYAYLNVEYLMDLTDGDQSFLVQILESYLTSIPENVQHLITSLNANNINNIRFYAHKLKGSFYFMGSQEVGKSFEEIEMNCKDDAKHSLIVALCSNAIRGVAAATAELQDMLSQVKASE